jgi:hypothetical protein
MDADEHDLHAIVLVENVNLAVGAVAFAYIDWPDAPASWCMMFAWVGDEWRRRGVMTRRWPAWRRTYGDFRLSPPLSEAMEAFVAKMKGAEGPRAHRLG